MDREKYLKQFERKRQRIVAMRDVQKWTWQKIADHFGITIPAVTKLYKKEKGL